MLNLLIVRFQFSAPNRMTNYYGGELTTIGGVAQGARIRFSCMMLGINTIGIDWNRGGVTTGQADFGRISICCR